MNLKGVGLFFLALLGVASPVQAGDYVVLKGDSVTTVAQKQKLSVELLRRANPEVDWEHLKAGARLTVPDRYVVKTGDTLYSLARGWGVDQSAVLALNGLAGPGALKSGQILFIPPSAPVRTTVPAVSSSYWPVERTPKATGDKLKSVTFATSGEPFRAVAPGTVLYIGEFRGAGRMLLVQASDKVVFAYGNFEDSTVAFGQVVVKGQVLGTTSSRSSQKLIFFAFKDSEPLDVLTVKR
jgi:LysM repeat protein